MKQISGKHLFAILILLSVSFAASKINLIADDKFEIPADISSKVIAEVGNDQITYAELSKAFKKNMNRKDLMLFEVQPDSLEDFLSLYIDYKLKVKDALNRGFDKDSSVMADIKQNRKILAESYYYEKKLMQPWINKMFEKRRREMKIAIIAVQFRPNAMGDTTTAFNKAKACLDMLNNGSDFYEVARDSSDDKESSQNGGVIPKYVTAGQVQRSIEDVLYSLKSGEYYKELINTKFGYFIVKVIDNSKREFVRASHILISINDNRDSSASEKIADKVLAELKAGAKFADMARKYSDDRTTAEFGGILRGFYSRSTAYDNKGKRLMPEFENAMFSLKDGQYGDKIYTDYGIHIVYRDSTKQIDPVEEKKDLKSIYKRIYFEKDKKEFLESMYAECGYKKYPENIRVFLEATGKHKTNLAKDWDSGIRDDLKNKPLYKISGKITRISDMVLAMKKNSELRGLPLHEEGIDRAIDKLLAPVIFEKATKTLEAEYPDFKMLMREFSDGILLFKVEALEVWNKLKLDSVLAKEYFDTINDNFKTDPSYDLSEIYILSDSLASDLYKRIQDGEDFDKLAEEHTQRAQHRAKKGKWGVVSVKKNELAKVLNSKNIKEPTVLAPFAFEKGFSIVKVNSYIPVRPKTFEEAIPDFAPKFLDLTQKRLTKEWLDSVRKQVKVKINKAQLRSINKKLAKKYSK